MGMGCEALLCVADRDAATDNIIPGRFSQRIPLDAAALMPGGAEAVKACAAMARANQTHDPGAQLIRVYPSCVFSGERLPDIRNQAVLNVADTSSAAATTLTVRITFPESALSRCALRCRVNGLSVAISIVSAHRQFTAQSASHKEMEAMTLVVNIAAAGVDGVAMLELVRSSSNEPGSLGLEQQLHTHLNPLNTVDQGNFGGDHHFKNTPPCDLSGVPVGLPAMPVLLISDPEVHAALEKLLQEQSDFGRRASTLYGVGATLLRGTASPQHALRFMCWAASKGCTGRALTRRLLSLYSATAIITSEKDAAFLLLHAAAAGDMGTVLEVLYYCGEAAEVRGFETDELAIFPCTDGETPLHRAAALYERSGNADVMYELLGTLAEPLAWTLGSLDRPQLTGSTLIADAVGAAVATLVGVSRRHLLSNIRAATPWSSTTAAIVQEAISACPFPGGATPYESARAAITLEMLSCTSSATRLLNAAICFDADNDAADSTAGAGDAARCSVYDDEGDALLSTIFPTGTAMRAFVATACKRWPTLGCDRTVSGSVNSVREWTSRGVRQFRSVMSWLGRHGPNGNSSLFLDYNPDQEQLWMDYRTRSQIATDHMAFTFMVVFMVVDLVRDLNTSLLGSIDQQATRAMTDEFLQDLRIPCMYTALIFFFKRYSLWYSRHRETAIYVGRLMAVLSILGSNRLVSPQDGSEFRRITLFFTLNLFPAFYPIRADRHLFIQVINTIVMLMCGGGHSYTVTSYWALRSVLACASFVITLLLEVQSRRSFALKQEQELVASEQRRTEGQQSDTKGREDWFKWGTYSDYHSKPATRDGIAHTDAKKTT